MARSQLSPCTILAEATADSRRLAVGWAAACFPLGSADAFAVKAGNSLCRLLSLSPAAGLPRHRGGRSGDVNPAAGLPRHGWEKWGREPRGWAPPTRVGEVGT